MPNIISVITKHALASTLVMLLAVGTLGVTAAEAFAPASNKPSSLLGFNTNKNSSSSSSSSDTSSSVAQTINNQEVDTGSNWTGKITLRFATDKACKTEVVDQYDPAIGDFLNEYISSYCENPNSSGTITNRNSKGFKQEIYDSVRNSLKDNKMPNSKEIEYLYQCAAGCQIANIIFQEKTDYPDTQFSSWGWGSTYGGAVLDRPENFDFQIVVDALKGDSIIQLVSSVNAKELGVSNQDFIKCGAKESSPIEGGAGYSVKPNDPCIIEIIKNSTKAQEVLKQKKDKLISNYGFKIYKPTLPKNESKMEKSLNNVAQSVMGLCGIKDSLKYTPKDATLLKSQMVISSKALNSLNSIDINNFNSANEYILSGKDYPKSSSDMSFNTAAITPFRTDCAGGFSYQIDTRTISYPGTESARLLIAGEGNSEFPSIVVRIIAKKDDDLIMLSAFVRDGYKYDSNNTPLQEPNYPCKYDRQLETCVNNFVKTDSGFKATIDKTVGDLLSTFELL
ncbi:MAG: hypothetical protein WCK98_00100 [bacterium]